MTREDKAYSFLRNTINKFRSNESLTKDLHLPTGKTKNWGSKAASASDELYKRDQLPLPKNEQKSKVIKINRLERKILDLDNVIDNRVGYSINRYEHKSNLDERRKLKMELSLLKSK